MNFIVGVGDFFYKVFTDFDFFKRNIGKIVLGVVAAIAFFVGLPAALTALGIVVIFTGLKWIWGKLKDVLPGKKIRGFFGGVRDKLGFASGGLTTGGMQLVGEKGPELVSLPAGSRVHTNSNSRRMTGGVVNNINITVNAKDSSKAEMKRIADELGRTITKQITRNVSAGILR